MHAELGRNSFIKNSFHLTEHISNLTISDNKVLFLDVISLSTNVPIDLVFEGTERRWHLIERTFLKVNFLKH